LFGLHKEHMHSETVLNPASLNDFVPCKFVQVSSQSEAAQQIS